MLQGHLRLERLGKFVSGSLVQAGSIVLQLVTVIILARALGPADFGRYSIYTALTLVLVEVLALGSGDVLVRMVALRPARFPMFYGHALILAALGLLPCTLILIIAIFAYQLAPLESLLIVSLAGATEIAFGRSGALGEQAFIAHQQATLANVLRLVINATRMMAAIAVLALGIRLDLVSWIAIQAGATALAGAMLLTITAHRLGGPRFRLLPHRITGGLPFSGTAVVRLLQLQVDRLLIGLVAGPHAVGVYSAASRVVGVGIAPMVTILRMSYPKFFSEGSKGIRSALPFALKVLVELLVISGLTTIFFFFAAPYLPILLGTEYSEAVQSAQLLAPVAIISAFQYAGGDLLSGSGRANLRLVATLATLFSVGTCILLFGGDDSPIRVVIAVLVGNAIGAIVIWAMVGQQIYKARHTR